MLIKRTSIFGKEGVLEVPITQEEFNRINSGELVQRVVPRLPAELREFLINGIMPEDYKVMFGE